MLAATNHELAEQTRLRATEDFKEGVKATEERRIANFSGVSLVGEVVRTGRTG